MTEDKESERTAGSDEGFTERSDASANAVSRRRAERAGDGVVQRDGPLVVVPREELSGLDGDEEYRHLFGREEYRHLFGREEYRHLFGREEYRHLFGRETAVELAGTVRSGLGEGQNFVSLAGYREQFVERLGYEPFPGTLNVCLMAESVARRDVLESIDSVPIDEWSADGRTYGAAGCYPATLVVSDGRRAGPTHVIVPDRTRHGEDQLELLAPGKLREVLGLEDGDEVTIDVAENETVKG